MATFKLTGFLHDSLEQTVDEEITKERLLNEMIGALAKRRMLLRDIALSQDPFERDEMIQEHSRQALYFVTIRGQLFQMALSRTEQEILDKQMALNNRGYLAQEEFIDRIVADEVDNPGEIILNDIQPLLQGILDSMIEQRDLIVADSEITRRNASQRYESGWVWVLLLYISSLVFTGALTLWGYYRQKSHQTALEYQATHDALTGLANRIEFERQLHNALESARHMGEHNVVLYLDLDQFKIVNDTSGHVAGDELLQDIAQEMRHCIRGSDLLSRLGGDEFGVLLWGCDEDKARQIAEHIRQRVADFRFVWSDREFSVGVSIGLVVLTPEFLSITDVMSAVDIACYVAKDHGRNQVHVYTQEDDETAARQGELHHASQIRMALSQNLFRLYYQQIHAIDANNDHTKVELLLRMSYEGELIGPDKFIPAAERYDLMPQVDRWVIQQVADMLSSGEHTLLQSVDTICINISGTSIADPAFIEFMMKIVDGNGLNGKHICIEITESAVIAKLSRAVKFINQLRRHGFTFALDDFGKGLSSYSYLKQLPVDYLKIDGSFVREMHPGSSDYVFVQSMNTVGKALGLQTIAEWVESEEVLEQLRTIGVDYAQGYYLSEVKLCESNDASLTLPGQIKRA
jgi:diguanylate cyclase (GGDEF)-like protein